MNDLLKQELRGGWLGVGDAYQPLDALGIALGAWFLYDGVTRRGPAWVTISLGAIMVFIHSERFFYAPKTRQGLYRLLNALDVTPADVVPNLTNRGQE